MTSLAATFALVLAPLFQEPDLSKPITFASLAAPAKRVVADLAAKTSLKLDVSPQVAPDVIFVQVDNVPTKELLDRIAKAVNGEWNQESDGTRRLIRPAGNANREANAERAERLAALQKEIKRYVDAMQKKPAPITKPPSGAGQIEMAETLAIGAQSKHIVSLLGRINLADLVFSEDDGRVVFSSSPTRMQRLLPGNLEPIVADMVQEHNKEAAARKNEPKAEPDDDEMAKWREFAEQFGLNRKPEMIEGRPAKLLLIGEQQEIFGGLSLTLRLYDAKGKAVIEDSLNLGISGFMEDAIAIAQPKPAASPSADDKPIEFSSTTQELNRMFRSITQGLNRTKFSAELEARLSRPDLYDPLSFSTSESLAAVAKHRKLNVVALLPDSSGSMMENFVEKPATVNTFLAQLEGSDSIKLEKLPGWLIVTPKHPVQVRRNRADRVALARLIAAAKAKGLASLDDIAAYALTSPSPFEDPTTMQYLMLFAPNAMQQGMMGMSDWNALKLYGTLNMSQRESLAEKGRIPLGNLMPQQQVLLTRMLFGSRSDLKVQDPNVKPKDEMGFMEMVRGMMPNQPGGDYRQEPTEVMPNGLPPSGYLTGDISKEPVGKAVGDDPMLMFGALGADELAMFRFFKEDPNMAMVAGMMPSIDRLQLGERTNITLKAFVAPDVALERVLQDQKIDRSSPIVSLDQLPSDFKAKIDKRYQVFKKTPFPAFPGGGGVKPPAH